MNTKVDGNCIACFLCAMGTLSNRWCIKNFIIELTFDIRKGRNSRRQTFNGVNFR